jgi:membrane protease YdiL (CAAX protease family)
MSLLGPPTRNAAEDAVVSLASRMPPELATWLRRGLLAVLLALAFVLARREAPRVARARWMLLEALVLALALGPVVGWMIGGLGLSLRPPQAEAAAAWLPFLMSVGAGVWEELVFRLALLGGLTLLLVRALKLETWVATGAAVLASALIFALYHHMGALGEPWQAARFAFRFLAGTILGVLFATRGLAVVVYMHVFYDLLCDVRALHG